MTNQKRWVATPPRNGILEVAIRSWQHFPTYVQQNLLTRVPYIFRGQADSTWPLESSLDRVLRATRRATFGPASHLARFRYAARGRRGPNPQVLSAENDWWALGQHHGLPTPLLDWTHSPFVAAFFAMAEALPPSVEHCAVYALHRSSVDARSLLLKDGKRRLLVFAPLADDNARLISQSGLFTRCPVGVSIDSWVARQFRSSTDGGILVKLTLPRADRRVALIALNRMNINHLTLFPDLSGAAQYCRLSAEFKGYSGF